MYIYFGVKFLTLVIISTIPIKGGRITTGGCDFEPCLETYSSLKSIFDSHRSIHQISALSPSIHTEICSQQYLLSECTKKQSKTCRGDLNYHFFTRLVQRLQSENIRLGGNCSDVDLEKSTSSAANVSGGRHGGSRKGSSEHRRQHHQYHSNHASINSMRNVPSKCSTNSLRSNNSKPFVGCALYGLTNLKSFSDPLNFTTVPYCSLAGTWSLLETEHFTVQVTNKGGLTPIPKDITTTTLVTVMIKSSECTERNVKVYQATFDEVPAMFADGSSTAGAVFLQEVKTSEHIRIQFPHLQSFIEIIRVIGQLPISTLSVTIRMPLELALNTSRDLLQSSASQNSPSLATNRGGLPLCFYGCPKTVANIKPRSIDASHNCPSNPPSILYPTETSENYEEIEETLEDEEYDHIEHSPLGIRPLGFDKNNSSGLITAVCTSLTTIQTILHETVLLDDNEIPWKFNGDENLINDEDLRSSSSTKAHHVASKGSYLFASAFQQALSNYEYFMLFVLYSLLYLVWN